MTPEYASIIPPQARWILDSVEAASGPIEISTSTIPADPIFPILAETTFHMQEDGILTRPKVTFFSDITPENLTHEMLHIYSLYCQRRPSTLWTDGPAAPIGEWLEELDTVRALIDLGIDVDHERRFCAATFRHLANIPEGERPLVAALAYLQATLVFPEILATFTPTLMRLHLLDTCLRFERRLSRWYHLGPGPLEGTPGQHHALRIACLAEAAQCFDIDQMYLFEAIPVGPQRRELRAGRITDIEGTLVIAARVLEPRFKAIPSRQEQRRALPPTPSPPAAERPVIGWPTAAACRRQGNTWTATIYAADLGDQVQAGQLAADSVTAGTVAAGAIRAIDAVFQTGAIQDADIGNLSANKITTGFLSADRIFGGTINGFNVNVTNLSASSIVTGQFSADRIGAGTISASVLLTSPTLVVTKSPSVTVNVGGSYTLRVADSFFGSEVNIYGTEVIVSSGSAYGRLTLGGLTADNGAGGSVTLTANSGLAINDLGVVSARKPAVSSPSADLTSLKTAVDAIIARLQAHGLIY